MHSVYVTDFGAYIWAGVRRNKCSFKESAFSLASKKVVRCFEVWKCNQNTFPQLNLLVNILHVRIFLKYVQRFVDFYRECFFNYTNET
jgi:hypothetical protein